MLKKDRFNRIILSLITLAVLAAAGAFVYSTISRQMYFNRQEQARIAEQEEEEAREAEIRENERRQDAKRECEDDLDIVVEPEVVEVTDEYTGSFDLEGFRARLDAINAAEKETENRRTALQDELKACMSEKGY